MPALEQARASRARRASSASRRSARPRRCIALIASGAFDTAQVPYNALNPSPGEAMPGRLSGAGLRPHPRSRRGSMASAPSASACSRAARCRAARSAIRSARGGRADRLGRELCGGRRARAAARADGARGPCRQPHRDGDALCHRQRASSPPPRSGLPISTSWRLRSRAVEKGPLSAAALARLRQLQAGFLGEAR